MADQQLAQSLALLAVGWYLLLLCTLAMLVQSCSHAKAVADKLRMGRHKNVVGTRVVAIAPEQDPAGMIPSPENHPAILLLHYPLCACHCFALADSRAKYLLADAQPDMWYLHDSKHCQTYPTPTSPHLCFQAQWTNVAIHYLWPSWSTFYHTNIGG